MNASDLAWLPLPTPPFGREDRMAVPCWCESATVLVEADMVWHGRTSSCGRPCCAPAGVYSEAIATAHNRWYADQVRRRGRQQDSVLDLIDDLAGLSDEHLVWLVAGVQAALETRVCDPRDPWAVLVRRPDVELRWAHLDGCRGLCERRVDGRYVITLEATLGRAERRAVLAHELAHIDLGTFWTDDTPLDEIEAGEVATDARAVELFDFDVGLLA